MKNLIPRTHYTAFTETDTGNRVLYIWKTWLGHTYRTTALVLNYPEPR